MKSRKRKMLRVGALLLGIFLSGCARSGEDSSLPGLTRKVAASGQPDLLILYESGLGPGTETALADLQSYLKAISGVDFPREEMAGFSPAGEWRWKYKNILVIGKDPGFFPGAVTENVEAEGYSLAALESGDNLIYFVYSPSSLGLQFGIYKLLTLLGVRFLHPAEEFVPSGQDLKFPGTLAVKSNPAFSLRGYHIHLLHPLEYFETFLVPSDEHLEEAKGYINWLVKNGQNYVQWSLLKTIDLDQWIVYADKIAAYAHARGVKVGINVIAWGGSSLQNSYVLVENTDDFAAEVRTRLEYLLRVPWDLVVAGQGEFIASDPAETIGWFNTMAETAADIRPETEFAIEIHVGDYENMYLDYQGGEVYYYHLPGYADPRVSVYVHTVMFYDLYRPAPAYGHADFSGQREFLFEELGERKVYYHPESAYWCTFDIDVPLFLPAYISSRQLDISRLAEDTASAGKPPLSGHVLFSSGNEWGFWLTDYLAGKMLWSPETPVSGLIGDFTAVFGKKSGEAARLLLELIEVQNRELVEGGLISFLTGEDFHDYLGYQIGITTHPPRLPYLTVYQMDAGARADLEENQLARLEDLGEEFGEICAGFEGLAGKVPEASRPWLAELRDGACVDCLRAGHSLKLYRAVLAGGEEGLSLLGEARGEREKAAEIISRREASYRYPLERYIGRGENPTIYRFRYLEQAHTLCFWRRQEEEVRYLLENGGEAPVNLLPTCID